MRTFILGAGFSKPAKFPLGPELFTEILTHAKNKNLYNHIKNEIDDYCEYFRTVYKSEIQEEDSNFEELMSYIDTRMFLMLEGSEELGTSQTIIRNLIAYSLHLHEKNMSDDDFLLYEKFASYLQAGDRIFTFNYDTILEKTFSRKNIPFRLYPTKHKESSRALESIEPDMDSDDIVLYKMHGSINWFDHSLYLEAKEYEKRTYGTDTAAYHPYNIPRNYITSKLLNGPHLQENTLRNLYILDNMEKYFTESDYILNAPVILSPSYSKILNINPLRELWYGFSQYGGYDQKVTIIGYSLPEHDEYVRIPLYRIVRGFQEFDEPTIKKSRLKIVDLLENDKKINDYKLKYGFVNWDENKTHCYFKGLSEEALDMIFLED